VKKDLSKRKRWEEKFYEWKKSNKSARSWCMEQKIPCSTFQRWIYIFSNKEEISKDSFTEILPEAETLDYFSSGIKLKHKEISIYLTKDFDEKTFQKMMRSFV
jgi:hypothetical protein